MPPTMSDYGLSAVIDRRYSTKREIQNVYIQKARVTKIGVKRHWRHHSAAASRRDESRRDCVGKDTCRFDSETVRVCRVSPRRDHGSMVTEGNRHRLPDL